MALEGTRGVVDAATPRKENACQAYLGPSFFLAANPRQGIRELHSSVGRDLERPPGEVAVFIQRQETHGFREVSRTWGRSWH